MSRERHKLELIDGQMLFDGRSVISYPSPRQGELRTVTVGLRREVLSRGLDGARRCDAVDPVQGGETW
jgi:hypothetical protein